MNARRTVLILAQVAALAACATFDRPAMTRLEPLKIEQGYAYFRYVAVADVLYPAASTDAEAERMRWLAIWLADNGYPDARPEILSRRTAARAGAIVDIYYDVRVKAKGALRE